MGLRQLRKEETVADPETEEGINFCLPQVCLAVCLLFVKESEMNTGGTSHIQYTIQVNGVLSFLPFTDIALVSKGVPENASNKCPLGEQVIIVSHHMKQKA